MSEEIKDINVENNDMYITDEELSNMSEEEFSDWLDSLSELIDKMTSDGDEGKFNMTLDDIQAAYDSPEFKNFISAMEEDDQREVLFDDEDDLEDIRARWAVAKELPEDAPEREKLIAFMNLYAAFYPFVRRVNPFWQVGADRLAAWAAMQELYPTVFDLDEISAEDFSELADPDMFARIGKPGIIAIGAIRQEDGEDTAAGIMIYALHAPDSEGANPVAEILWIYVAEEFRGDHVGDDLMASMYYTLNGAGVEAVTVSVPAQGLLPAMVCDFLSAWHIYFDMEPVAEHVTTLGDLSEIGLTSAASLEGEISSLEELGLLGFEKAVNEVAGKAGEEYPETTPYGVISKELSLAYKDDSGNKAILINDIMPSGTISVRRMLGSSDDEDIIRGLISSALERAGKIYAPNTIVVIEPKSGESAELMDKLIPDHGLRMELIGANVIDDVDVTTEEFDQMRQLWLRGER